MLLERRPVDFELKFKLLLLLVFTFEEAVKVEPGDT